MKKLQYLALGAIMTSAATAQNNEVNKNAGKDNIVPPHILNMMSELQLTEGSIVQFSNTAELQNKDVPRFFTKMNGVQTFTNTTQLPRVYLGVLTSKTEKIVSSQLGIHEGLGLSIINKIDKESPAGKAGIQQYDVLYKLNDQLLVNRDQLLTLLGSYKVGDKIKLSHFKKGELVVSEVTLAKRQKTDYPTLDSIPKLGAGAQMFLLDEDTMQPRMRVYPRRTAPTTSAKFKKGKLDIINSSDAKMDSALGSIIQFSDNKGSYTLKRTAKGLHLNAKDTEGKEIFKGLIEPDKEWAKVPAEIAPSVDKMRKLFIEMKK